VEDEGMVMYGKPELFDSSVEFGLVGKVEVENAIAIEAVEMVMGMGCGIEALRGSQRQSGHKALLRKGTEGAVDRGEADLFALFPKGKVEFLGRGMIHAALKLLEHAVAFSPLLPVHDFHFHYKSQ
jgi:hypothetical protein